MGTCGMQGSLPSTAFLSFPPSAEDPGGALLLESVKGEGEGRWPGKGGWTRATSSSCANTSVFPLFQGKSGHLLSAIPVLIIDDPKSIENRGNEILFSLCQNITIRYLEQIRSFLV